MSLKFHSFSWNWEEGRAKATHQAQKLLEAVVSLNPASAIGIPMPIGQLKVSDIFRLKHFFSSTDRCCCSIAFSTEYFSLTKKLCGTILCCPKQRSGLAPLCISPNIFDQLVILMTKLCCFMKQTHYLRSKTHHLCAEISFQHRLQG